MLPTLSVACRYRLNRGDRIACRVQTGVILGTLKERVGDTVSVVWNSRTYRNRQQTAGSFASVKYIQAPACLRIHPLLAIREESRAWTGLRFGQPLHGDSSRGVKAATRLVLENGYQSR